MATVASSPVSSSIETIIQDAMFAAKVLGQDQTPQAGDLQLALRILNRMLTSWANESLMAYTVSQESFTLTANTSQYSTTLLTNGRPISVESFFIRYQGVDYPGFLLDEQQFNDIPVKTSLGVPQNCFYDSAYPDATFNFFYTPDQTYTCFVDCRRELTGQLSINDLLYLPPGYEAAIVPCLAVEIYPYFRNGAVPNDLLRTSQGAKRVLKRTNTKVPILRTVFDNQYSDWRTG